MVVHKWHRQEQILRANELRGQRWMRQEMGGVWWVSRKWPQECVQGSCGKVDAANIAFHIPRLFCSEQCKSAPQVKQVNRRQVEKGKLRATQQSCAGSLKCGSVAHLPPIAVWNFRFKKQHAVSFIRQQGARYARCARQCQAFGADHGELSWRRLRDNAWRMIFSWWPAYRAVDGYHCMHYLPLQCMYDCHKNFAFI